MLNYVELENFRGFRSFKSDVAAITAFLGPNSSGKTTALVAVRLAADLLRIALESDVPAKVITDGGEDWVVVTSGALLGDHRRLLPLADWQALFVDQQVGVGVHFAIDLGFEDADPIQEVWIKVGCGNNEQLKLDVWVRARGAVQAVRGLAPKSQHVTQRLKAYVAEHAPLAVLVPPFYGTVPDEEYRSRAVIDRLLGSGDQSHVVRNLVAGLDSDRYEQLNAFLRDTLGAELTYRTSGDALQTEPRLVVHFRDSNGDIELSAAGAGLVNLVALYTALSRWRHESAKRRVIFLLDEPEAHLHPRLQAESAERIGRLVTRDFAAQLLLATHSVDILNRLSTTGALLVRCDRTADPSALPLDSDADLFDDLASWADLAPYTAINFLASRRVLFCEGDDELAVLPRLAELRFRNDPERRQRFRRWALVRLTGASNQPLAKMLNRLVNNDVVRAQAKNGGFEVVLLLDRDHERAPGVQQQQADGVTDTIVVWSRHSLESLLVEPSVLAIWIRAVVSDGGTDLAAVTQQAAAEADADPALNDAAIDQLAAKLAKSGLTDEHGQALRGEQLHVHANRLARERVRAEPAVWQRGKDRARFILGRIRPSIGLPARNQFPTDVVRLVQRADLNKISDPLAALPAEVATLLEQLTARA